MMTVALLGFPALGGLICATMPEKLSRQIALATSFVGMAMGAWLYVGFDAGSPEPHQFFVSVPWIKSLGINFALGIDGLSFPFLILTKTMIPIAILSSWRETRHQKFFMILFLLLDSAMTGTFLATDLFLFYVFWELMLVPMFLLIGVWGSKDRIFASLKFFLYTFTGSVLMLVAIWYLFGRQSDLGIPSANIRAFYSLSFPVGVVVFGLSVEDLVFLAFAIAFLIKIPLFPFHTWLPDAHVQAPTGGSILLAAVLLKMGVYGLLRFAIPICPHSFDRFLEPIGVLAMVGAIYGAWVAYQQTDLKKLVAYSSVSHLALVVLGICAKNGPGLGGAILQSVNHGITTGALFFLVGILYERRHTREFSQFGGLAAVIPRFSVFLTLVCCASMGVPGLNGFVGEFLILSGVFLRNSTWAVAGVSAIIFGAVYTLALLRKLLFGPVTVAENASMPDLRPHEMLALIALSLLIVMLGVFPRVLIDKTNPMVTGYWLSSVGQHQ